MKTELTITISADAVVGVEVDGVTGPCCADISRELEEAMGSVIKREKKAAFYLKGEPEQLLARSGEKP